MHVIGASEQVTSIYNSGAITKIQSKVEVAVPLESLQC